MRLYIRKVWQDPPGGTAWVAPLVHPIATVRAKKFRKALVRQAALDEESICGPT
jgi:hypothetical protein